MLITLVIAIVLARSKKAGRGWLYLFGLVLTFKAMVQVYDEFGWTNDLPMRGYGNAIFLSELVVTLVFLWLLATLARKYDRLHISRPRTP